MIIDSIEIYRVNMPLVYPFRTAFGNNESIESVLVKMTSGGKSGWGETSPWQSPAYSPEWAAGVFIVMRDWLAPRLIGKDITSGAQLQNELALFKGNFFAKAGLDLAWWDLHAQLEGKPLWQIIGGKSDTIEVGADFGVMETFDLLLKEIDGAVRQGFKRVKLKYRPGWELDMIATVRKHFPKEVFHVDCNSAYRLSHSDMLRQLDQFNLAMIEQPLAHDDLHEHAQLQKLLKTPICLDESITSVVKAEQAIELGACRWINIKPGRVGGITNALAINKVAESAGIPVWIGGMLESSVGGAHCQALATLANAKYPADVFPTSRFYAEDLSDPPLELSGPSTMRLAAAPGIGHLPKSGPFEETEFGIGGLDVMKQLRVGIVGCGEVTQIMHLPSLAQLPEQFIVTALCDVSQQVLQTVGDQWRVTKRYSEYRDLLAQADVDVVLIANPDAYHAEVTVAAMQASKHVLIEKPMCMTLREASEITAAQQRAGVIVQVGYMRRYAPAFVAACEMLPQLGPIRLARVHDVIGRNPLFIKETSHAVRGNDVSAQVIAENKRRYDELIAEATGEVPKDVRSAYGLMLSLSTHDLSAMRELLGMPKRVLHAATRQGGLYMTATFDYGDYVCQFETGIDNIPRFDAHLEVYGYEQMLRVQYDTPYVRNLPIRLFVTETNGKGGLVERAEHHTWGDAFVCEWQAFHENVTGKRQPKTSPQDFRHDLELFRDMIALMAR